MSYQRQLQEHYKAVRERLRMGQPRAAIVPVKAIQKTPLAISHQPNTASLLRPGLLSEREEAKIVEQALDATNTERYQPFMGGRKRSQGDRFEDEIRLSPKLPPLPGIDLKNDGMLRWYDVLKAVAAQHGVDPNAILGASRKRDIVRARFEVFYRLRIDVKMSYEKIAYFMKRDHSSVLHGVYKLRDHLLDEQNKRRDDGRAFAGKHPTAEAAHTASLLVSQA